MKRPSVFEAPRLCNVALATALAVGGVGIASCDSTPKHSGSKVPEAQPAKPIEVDPGTLTTPEESQLAWTPYVQQSAEGFGKSIVKIYKKADDDQKTRQTLKDGSIELEVHVSQHTKGRRVAYALQAVFGRHEGKRVDPSSVTSVSIDDELHQKGTTIKKQNAEPNYTSYKFNLIEDTAANGWLIRTSGSYNYNDGATSGSQNFSTSLPQGDQNGTSALTPEIYHAQANTAIVTLDEVTNILE